MDSSGALHSQPLYDQVLDILTERIRSGAYPAGAKLPAENTLALEFGVSRATIRSAISALMSRGLVSRRRGVGTFVNSLAQIRDPLNQFIAFPDLIASQGSEPGFRQIDAVEVAASPEMAETLQVEPGSSVLQVRKLFTADGVPVVYCINYIPAWVYRNQMTPEEVVQPGITQPIFDFLERRCSQQIERYVASVRAELLRKCDLDDLALPYDPFTPVLIIDEIGYNLSGRPVHHSVEYHPDNRMRFELIRSRSSLAS
jgi:GntR family transcriptional regulator